MTVHFNGPVLENDKSAGGGRGEFRNLPAGAIMHPDYVVVMDDFVEYDANDWTIVKDSGAAVAAAADTLNGAITLTSAATTDGDGASIQKTEEGFALTVGKRLWFKARLKVSDADDMDMFVGLCETFATNPEACIAASNRVGWQLDDGDATPRTTTESGDTESTTDAATDTSQDLADDTYVELGFYWDGKNRVDYYKDGEYIATETTNIPTANLLPAVFSLSGSNSGTKVTTVDYVFCCMER